MLFRAAHLQARGPEGTATNSPSGAKDPALNRQSRLKSADEHVIIRV